MLKAVRVVDGKKDLFVVKKRKSGKSISAQTSQKEIKKRGIKKNFKEPG